MRLGAHMSIEGGIDRAVDRARRAGCEALQIFTKSSNQWKARALGEDEITRFRSGLADEGIGPVAAHGSYLINLASPDEGLYRKSVESFAEELTRCARLGIPYLVAHPGSHVGSGVAGGVRRIAAALDEVFARAPVATTSVLLEITAGQGSTIGSRFEEIAEILSAAHDPERIGVCFDTCHAFAAGFDLRTERGYVATFDAFDKTIGLDRLLAFHLNDSKKDLGSRLDRHEHIGRGWIGLEAFRLLMNDGRFEGTPMILETPKGSELREDIENLAVLRSLRGEVRPKVWTPPHAATSRPRALERRTRRARTSHGGRGRTGGDAGLDGAEAAAGRTGAPRRRRPKP